MLNSILSALAGGGPKEPFDPSIFEASSFLFRALTPGETWCLILLNGLPPEHGLRQRVNGLNLFEITGLAHPFCGRQPAFVVGKAELVNGDWQLPAMAYYLDDVLALTARFRSPQIDRQRDLEYERSRTITFGTGKPRR